ncbi:unnamed protein product, partial [Ixodes persulcatus]
GVVTAEAESRRWVPSRESAPPCGDPVVQGPSPGHLCRRAGLRRRLPGPRAVRPAPPVPVGAVGQPPGGHLSAFGTSDGAGSRIRAQPSSSRPLTTRERALSVEWPGSPGTVCGRSKFLP